MKKCPFCAESIQNEAVYCRYCKRDIPPQREPQSFQPILNPSKIGDLKYKIPLIVIGSLFGICLILLVSGVPFIGTKEIPETLTPTPQPTLTITPTPTTTPSPTPKPIDSEVISSIIEESPSTFGVYGKILFNGNEIQDVYKYNNYFSVYNYDNEEYYDENLFFDRNTGEYFIDGLESGNYGLYGYLGTGKHLPGEYELNIKFKIDTEENYSYLRYDVNACQIIHLIQPHDNFINNEYYPDRQNIDMEDLFIEWDEVKGADYYLVKIGEYQESTKSFPEIFSLTLTETSLAPDFMAKLDGTLYNLTIYGYDENHGLIAYLMDHSEGKFYGWDYRFTLR